VHLKLSLIDDVKNNLQLAAKLLSDKEFTVVIEESKHSGCFISLEKVH
jgi:hypothetical protein